MVKVYIEPRPKGRPEGTAINDYAVETSANVSLATRSTQKEAIDWAETQSYSPIMVARVRNTDKGNPDHWREHR